MPLTIRSPLPDIRLHCLVTVLCSKVALRREEELDVLFSGVEAVGVSDGSRHDDDDDVIGVALV